MKYEVLVKFEMLQKQHLRHLGCFNANERYLLESGQELPWFFVLALDGFEP